MINEKIEITKDVYDRAINNGRNITGNDKEKIFSESQLYGYGIYGAVVEEKDGKYYCLYKMGSTCD